MAAPLAAAGSGVSKAKSLSRRIDATDTPVIDFTRRVMATRKDAMSLAQGIVYWGPPPVALERLSARMASEPAAVSGYAPNEGLPALRAALRHKLAHSNKLPSAFLNALLALCDVEDRVVLFLPYYFDHLMAMQMTGSADRVVLGECDPATMRPSLEWLKAELAGPQPPKMVVVVNPCNPTGVLLSRDELEGISAACAAAGCWLLLDNTYEDFIFAEANRSLLRSALAPLEPHVVGGEGAIYLWARLPPGCEDDRAVVEWLVAQAGVCVIPGSACGMPGHIRCSYGNLSPDKFPTAVERLRAGIAHLAQHGMTHMGAPPPPPQQQQAAS
ncbi:Aspartate aminotransferase [Tetrabaena socialis]|uniref:Aspartate aminotransferase n=1 Tax=Tetrabaena socialis TaxID=47790 RepID=A0A2J8A5G0_9CHLO|nr:Aspartate aminotransferase [Tetrabaena socialis]|eukprot:PNH07737.1 Aspartate aminotransferase [Tetrabaena socialis]